MTEQQSSVGRPHSVMVTESYAKERKVNANKQFSYNKLVNERSKNARLVAQQHKPAAPSKSAPSKREKPTRPPQPRIDQEGLLIDLSPVETANVSATATVTNLQQSSGVCLLDEPIEVPTEESPALDVFHDALDEPVLRCPPPYQQPPQYSNLIEGNLSQNASPNKQQVGQGLYSNALQANDMMSNLSRELYAKVGSDRNGSRPEPIGAEGMQYGRSSAYAAVPNPTMALVGPVSGSDLSERIQQQLSLRETLGGAIPKRSTPMIDQEFIAGLEKYVSSKDQAAMDVNSVQALTEKQVSPKKKFTNSQSEAGLNRNYASHSDMQSIYANSAGTGINATTAIVEQMWQEQQDITNQYSMTNQIYSNNNPMTNTAAETVRPVTTSHNFVAVSNRPVSTISSAPQPQHHYNTVYGGISGHYGTTESVLYDSCPPNAIYSSVQQPPFAVYDEVAAEELLQPVRPAPTVPVLSAQQIQRRMQSNIYSDVASIYGDAGCADGDSSAYGDVIENQKITAFCVEVGPEASVIDARRALVATNWDHRLAVRHFKVDKLMKLGLGTKETCEATLARSGWSLEVAASILLEK